MNSLWIGERQTLQHKRTDYNKTIVLPRHGIARIKQGKNMASKAAKFLQSAILIYLWKRCSRGMN